MLSQETKAVSRIKVQVLLIAANMNILVTCLITTFVYGCLGDKLPDWLVTDIKTTTTLTKTERGTLVLSNGLIAREFALIPDFVTVDYYSFEKRSSLLRALNPEGIISIDGVKYNISGAWADIPRAYLNRTDLDTFMRLDPDAFHFLSYEQTVPQAPYSYKPKRGAPKDIVWPPKGVRLDVAFRAPQSAPDEHKRLTIYVHYEMYDGIPLLVKWISAELSSYKYFDLAVEVEAVEVLGINQQWLQPWLHVETDWAHGTEVIWGTDPHVHKMPGSYEPLMVVRYPPSTPQYFEDKRFATFKVHELVIGSNDPERIGLAKHRKLRLLAPQTQENPIFFHLTDHSSKGIRMVVDQMADVGFEMLIFSFGSGFNLESTNASYIARIAADVAYAKERGIEVGGYDLICWDRGVPAWWKAITHGGIYGACFASGWYDYLLKRALNFIDQTGLSMVETDGPYPGYACSSTNHSHHLNASDSILRQLQLQNQFYKIMVERGVYVNQPDLYFYFGANKAAMGYNENQFSLPRWQDISISRQGMYDDTYHLIPSAGWMFVPLVIYHHGGADVKFEPLRQHKVEYEWALAQYMGAGVAACYRGYELFDCNDTKALVKKWVSFYKTYRDILNSDIIHVRRADMQDIDSFMHVNSKLENKGLAMVFNPTQQHITTELTLPLYYTGLTTTAMIGEQAVNMKSYELERDYSVDVKVDLPALGVTWFLVK